MIALVPDCLIVAMMLELISTLSLSVNINVISSIPCEKLLFRVMCAFLCLFLECSCLYLIPTCLIAIYGELDAIVAGITVVC